MRLINDFILIKTLRVSHEAGGLELYGKNNQIRYNYGEVIQASPNTVLEKGDQVYYDSAAGSDLRHKGEKFLIIRERDIGGIMEEDEKE